MEPREAVELNNLEVSLSNAEKTEEQAILSYLSSGISQSSSQIKYMSDKSVRSGSCFCKSCSCSGDKWGLSKFLCCRSENSQHNSPSLDVTGIRHPLLLESSLRNLTLSRPSCSGSNQEADMREYEVLPGALDFPVPIDIKIGNGVKVVVISGPNTGGKTASMKNLGLASMMLNAGMYLPAQDHPKLPWFDLVLADIGDQQSLEQSLSTFSGHITQICNILKVATVRSLVLLDEIGSGTDPSEGVALSASILQYLKERVNLAVVTTHYADLTRLKEKDVQFENAAMEFSLESLQPTYQVLWGSMGESNALNLATTIGFDGKIIERAQSWVKKLTPEKMQKLNSSLYQSLVEERKKLENQAEAAASLHSDGLRLYHEIHDETVDLDVREAALKAKETKQIQQELKIVKAEIDALVQKFEKQLENTEPKDFNMLLKESESTIASIIEARQPEMDESVDRNASSYVPQIGEQIVIKGLGNKLATIVEAPSDDNTVLVQYGKIRVRANVSSINSLAANGAAASAPRSRKKGPQTKRFKNLKNLTETINNERASYGPVVQTSKNTLDLRGMRAEEATLHVEMTINARAPNSVIFIIHGMGTGVLKELVIELLQKHPRIQKFEQESPMNYGCTVAYIK